MKVISLERKSVNRLNDEATRRRLKRAIKALSNDVKVTKNLKSIVVNGGYRHLIELNLRNDSEILINKISSRVEKIGWAVSDSTTVLEEVPTQQTQQVESSSMGSKPPFQVPDLTPEIFEKYFGDIYEREAHIRLIHDSIKNYTYSGGRIRSHVLLYGEPEAAKSSLYARFIKWFTEYEGNVWNRILKIDSHTTTKAGLENLIIDFADTGTMPEIIVIEEIEKRDKLNDLDILISIMQDGYLSKLNARIGQKTVQTPVLIWATCNDFELLQKIRFGAIWSRFNHKWRVFRPSRESMKKILEDYIVKTNGDISWVEPIMELSDKLNITNPRTVLAWTDGRERLLTGEYQKDMLSVMKKEIGLDLQK